MLLAGLVIEKCSQRSLAIGMVLSIPGALSYSSNGLCDLNQGTFTAAPYSEELHVESLAT
jgi:hypothetical protein